MQEFVLSVTSPRPVPLTPGIVLRTADDITALWERTGSPEPPFWAFPWAGGQALARHVLDHPDLVAGRRVLDLASGSGLVAAAATALNARANHVTLTTTTGDLLDTTPDVDVLLAGDVFYDRDMAARVEPFLLAAHHRGTLVLVGDPQRSHMPRGWTRVDTFPVPVPHDLEGVTVKTTTVWRPAP